MSALEKTNVSSTIPTQHMTRHDTPQCHNNNQQQGRGVGGGGLLRTQVLRAAAVPPRRGGDRGWLSVVVWFCVYIYLYIIYINILLVYNNIYNNNRSHPPQNNTGRGAASGQRHRLARRAGCRGGPRSGAGGGAVDGGQGCGGLHDAGAAAGMGIWMVMDGWFVIVHGY